MAQTDKGSTAAYLRISQDRQGLELGVDRQRAGCRELAERRGWPAPVEYVDNDISAYSGRKRPGYVALLAAIDRGEVTRVVVWHPSRLWRSRRERAEGIETMKAHRVTLVCVQGPDLDMSTAYGRGLAGLVGEFDTMESDVKSERVGAAVRQRAEQGRYHGGPRLFGYVDGVTVDPVEAAVVASWFDQVLAGRSVGAMARDAGLDRRTLRLRLRNPRYAGLRVLGGREHPGGWPAIVTPEVWRAAQDILNGRAGMAGKTAPRKWLGSGLYLCQRCERPVRMGGSTSYSTGQRYNVYRCKNASDAPGCWRSWRQEPTDAFVIALTRERLGRGDLADLVPTDRPDLEALRREAAGIRARLRTLAADYVRLGLDEDQVAEANRAGRARLAEIEAQTGTGPDHALAQLLTAEDPVALFDAIPEDQPERRAAIIRCLFTVRLGAPPRGRQHPDPERYVSLAPPGG